MASQKVNSQIVSNKSICGGAPCFEGTRIPVYMVIEMLYQGMSFEQVVEQYPKLTTHDVRTALIFCSYVLGR